jgi:hypothetical protein
VHGRVLSSRRSVLRGRPVGRPPQPEATGAWVGDGHPDVLRDEVGPYADYPSGDWPNGSHGRIARSRTKGQQGFDHGERARPRAGGQGSEWLGERPAGRACGKRPWSPSMLEAGRVPDVRESSTALCVKRGGLGPHNLLMRGRSRSGAALFRTKPERFREVSAAPAPSKHNPTPWSTGESKNTLQGGERNPDTRPGVDFHPAIDKPNAGKLARSALQTSRAREGTA